MSALPREKEELLNIVSALKNNIKNTHNPLFGTWKKRNLISPQLPQKQKTTNKNNMLPPNIEKKQMNPSISDLSISSEEKLILLRKEIGNCLLCPLGSTRNKLVYGVGNPNAVVMVVGEGPGFMEDQQGEPFVGPAGQLLDKILAAIELSRHPQKHAWKQVYIANMVKCHPMINPQTPEKRGNDRAPHQEEMAICSQFLMKQIQIIRPRFLLLLGATATKYLMQTSKGITSLRGKWTDFLIKEDTSLQIKLLPTFHPSALLRNPELKKYVWEDIKKLKTELYKMTADNTPS